MFRRTIANCLVLTSLFITILAAPLAAFKPKALGALSASVAQADEGILTFVPTPLTLDAAVNAVGTANSPEIVLQQLRIPDALDVDVPFTLETTWSNTGAILAEYWEIVYQLRLADNSVALALVSELDLGSTLASTEAVAEQFWLSPTLAAGSYNLTVLVRDPEGIRSPLALAINGVQPDGSYLVGSVQVRAVAPVPALEGPYFAYLPMAMISDQDDADTGATVTGTARGYLTTPQEMQAIKQKADQNRTPYSANVRELLNHSSMSSVTSWVSQSSITGNQVCSDGSQKDSSGRTIPRGPNYIIEGSRLAYGKSLTANLSTGTRAEDFARETRKRILDLVDTTGWGGSLYSADNQCILYLSWYVPPFVMAADMLEAFPNIWTATDKRSFQRWLATQAYPKVAWASRARTNNWGSGGSYAAAMIADYLWDYGSQLTENSPSRTLSAGTAYYEHTREQLSRMSTTVADRDQRDSRCLPYKGIQPGGGIPDELRRAGVSNPSSMCQATYLPSSTGDYSSAYRYMMVHLEPIVGHAELALRRGDARLYDSIASNNSGSLLRAIKFIIKNPAKPSASYDWDVNRKAMLYVAYRHYRDSAIKERLHSAALRSGQIITYGRLTHGFAEGDSISAPPTVPPPAR